MTLAAGRLRHVVSVQERVELLDSNGQVVQDPATGEISYVWQEYAQRRAAIEPLSGREFIQSQATQSKVTGRIVLRADPAINAAMRIVHLFDGKVYNLEAILKDKDSGLEYITVLTSEGVSPEGL